MENLKRVRTRVVRQGPASSKCARHSRYWPRFALPTTQPDPDRKPATFLLDGQWGSLAEGNHALLLVRRGFKELCGREMLLGRGRWRELISGWRGTEMEAEDEPRYTDQNYAGEDAAGVGEEIVPVAGAARTEEVSEFHKGAEQE